MADINQIEALVQKVKGIAPSGFAIAFHIRLTSPDFLFQSYPKEWTDIYSEKGYVMVDPIVKFGFANDGHTRWSDLSDTDEHNILQESAAFGMKFGVAIAIDANDSRSFAGFSRADREYTDDEITELTEDVQTLHRLTASKSGMPQDIRDALQRLSIQMTRRTATSG